ncbi:WcaF family extracellular polysaccharide biosynthesis acetyltransferase [Christiangramia sp. ASW11-125]|uniref:WcaF family extracellular polysaccharide biosynthesis acetyltransferase n=1 Tax=Christiangramia sp. ASW11-125 TaxID=3400701 RepID=UPI003AB0BD3D
MKTDLSKYNNSWYQPGGRLKILLWYLTNVLFFQNSLNPSSELKVALLKLFGAKIGEGVVIKPGVNIKYPWKLEIGNHTWIGEKVWIDNLGEVKIGSNVCISQGAMLLCGNHNYKKLTFDLIVQNITLEDGVWIGAQSVVCPGVICKSHSILSVSSVANKNLEAYKVYQGNPAVKVRPRIVDEIATSANAS